MLIVIAAAIASFFTPPLRFSVFPGDWQVAVVCLIQKKSSDRSNLNNFRAVYRLCFSIDRTYLGSASEFCLSFLRVLSNNSVVLFLKVVALRLS